jgi:hypothetical protein
MKAVTTPKKPGLMQSPRRVMKDCLPKWVRVTSLLLSALLACSVVVGTPLHPSDRGCNMPAKTSDCGHQGMTPSAPGLASVPLCCALDCQEPAPTGSGFIVQRPAPSSAFLQQIVLPLPSQFDGSPHRPILQTLSHKPPDTYLRNLALLI